MAPDNKLPNNLLLRKGLNSDHDKFYAAKNADIKNERRPGYNTGYK
jgi:hypothetical protein